MSLPVFPTTRRAALVGGLSLLAAPACAAPPPVILRASTLRRGGIYGAAVEPQSLEQDADFAALVRAQCNLITAENALKWDALRPTPYGFDFTEADRLAAFAHQARLPMHGHCLVWHEALPDWVRTRLQARDPRVARDLLEDHIARVVGRYDGTVVSWDVANEVVERNDRRPDGLRRSPWFEAMGPDYLDLAFHAARAADQRATLALADYGLEYDDIPWMVEKRGTMLDLLRTLLARGVPVHALALQGHLRGDHPPAFGQGLADFLAAVADLGLKIFITELDVDDQKTPGSPAQRDQATAEIYARFLDVALNQPAVEMVVTWGLSDRYTSKSSMFPRADGAPVRPLPFDADLKPKPAAYALAEAFR